MPPTTSVVLSVDRNVLDQDYPFPTESEANPEDIPLLTPKMSPSSLAFFPPETTRTLLLIRSANNVHLFTNIIYNTASALQFSDDPPRASSVRVSIYIDVCPLVLFIQVTPELLAILEHLRNYKIVPYHSRSFV